MRTTRRVLWKWAAVAAPLALLSGCEIAPSSDRAPEAVIEASSLRGSAPLAVRFDGSRSSDDADIVIYEWSFDGAVGATGVRCAHTFGTGGTHTAALTVLDAAGNAGTARVDVQVDNAPPLASFRLSDGAPWVHAPMTADATGSLDPEGLALTFRWDFGDGATAEGAVVSHAYDEEGAYTLTLVVRDVAGAEATADHRVLVQKPLPGGGCGGNRPVPLRR